MTGEPISPSLGAARNLGFVQLRRAVGEFAPTWPATRAVTLQALAPALYAAPVLMSGLALVLCFALVSGQLVASSPWLATLLIGVAALAVAASLAIGRWLQLHVVRPLRELAAAAPLAAGATPSILPREIAALRERLAGEAARPASERDRLTGLLSRSAVHEAAAAELEAARLAGRRLTLAVLDVERLRDVNTTYNYGVGDELLCQLGRRLSAVCPAETHVARVGGDRFAVLIREEGGQHDPGYWPGVVLTALGRPLCIDGCELQVTLSLGTALFPEHGVTFPQLLRAAELAVENARRGEGRRWAEFDPRQNQAAILQRALEKELKHALESNAMLLHYQPQIDLGTGRVLGVEALLRWQHPERGMIPPANFIPVAEASGLIRPLGAWVLVEAARAARRWRDMGFEISVAVNVSAAQLRRQDLVHLVDQVLRSTGLPPEALELELTESMFVDPTQVTMRRVIQGISNMGVRLAIDDFGTGYSSLGYLKRLPVDKIKIDKSFVRELGREETDAAIVRSIIGLARVFGKRVLAEGVEESSQAHFLKGEGCDEAQGFYFSRPMPESACTAFLQRHAPRQGATPMAPAALAG